MGISSALGSSALLPAGLGFRNLVINGGASIWQRKTTFTGTSGIVYTADRWFTYRATGSTGHTVTRQTGPTGFQYCIRVARDSGNTATTAVYLEQDLESVNSIPVAGQQVSFSFWARSGANFSATSSALSAEVWTGTGTDQRIQSGFTGSATPISYTATLTTTWQRFIVYGTLSSSATQIGVRFGFTPTGTAGAADYFEITGVQLEANYQATPFEQRPFGVELSQCQRYYEKSFNTETVPTNGANTTSLHTEVGAPRLMSTGATSNDGAAVFFRTQKRATPTITLYGNSNGKWLINTTAFDSSIQGTGEVGFSIYQTYATSLQNIRGHWVAEIEL